MGTSYIIANVTKKQFLNPMGFDEPFKIQGFGGQYISAALALLVVRFGSGVGRAWNSSLIGSWHGDAIFVPTDLDEANSAVDQLTSAEGGEMSSLYQVARRGFDDISHAALIMLTEFSGQDGVAMELAQLARRPEREWLLVQLAQAVAEHAPRAVCLEDSLDEYFPEWRARYEQVRGQFEFKP